MSSFIDIAKLLVSKQLRFNKGEILLFNQPSGIIPIDWMVELQKELYKRNEQNIIYYAGKEMGLRYFRNMYNLFKLSQEDIVNYGLGILTLAGWGDIKATVVDFENKIIIEQIKGGGPEAKMLGYTGKPVCHFIRGCAGGGARAIFGEDSDAIETKCVSEGTTYCEFMKQPTRKWNKKDPLVKEQLALPKVKTMS